MYKTVEWYLKNKKIILDNEIIPDKNMKVLVTFVNDEDYNNEDYNNDYWLYELDDNELSKEDLILLEKSKKSKNRINI